MQPDDQFAMFGSRSPPCGTGEYRGLQFLEVEAKSDRHQGARTTTYGFSLHHQPYRGCSHACTYCFARPTHEYLGLDAGTDFDTKIVVKTNAVELTRHSTVPGSVARTSHRSRDEHRSVPIR